MVVNTVAEFQRHWGEVHNFLMQGECVPFAFDLPPLEQIVDELRRDPDTEIMSGTKGSSLNVTSIRDTFRDRPLAEAMQGRFAIAHYKLANFYGPGRFLEGFEPRVLVPWRQWLTRAGFTWTRCYPIIFISGRGCATNYHMDLSNVLAWQRCGTKRFCSVAEPERWAPLAVRQRFCRERERYWEWYTKPAALQPADCVVHDMPPGALLWNAYLTPHWVDGSDDQPSLSINISHGGLRHQGRLCRHEEEVDEQYRW
jgi:hypothetical protein